MSKGIDRAVPFISPRDIAVLLKLKAAGYSFIGRYLSKSKWKCLSPAEAKFLSAYGFYLVTVYQNSNNAPKYFTAAYGANDAADAIKRAVLVGQPKGTPIYFAVDFQADTADEINAVIAYFKAAANTLKGSGYKLGVYGSERVCHYVTKNVPQCEFEWQTIAWSGGKVSDSYNLFQWKCDTHLPEDSSIQGIDLVKSNGNGGGWRLT